MKSLEERIAALPPEKRKILEMKLKKEGIDISKRFKATGESIYGAIRPTEKKEYYPLSPAQKRVYVAYRVNPEALSYNQHSVMELHGNITREKMEAFFKGMIRRHETLRTYFVLIDKKPVQLIKPVEEVEAVIEFHEFHREELPEFLKSFKRPFDLTRPPLMRVACIHAGNDNYLILGDAQHMVGDFTSVVIMGREYIAFENKEKLPPLRLQYRDFLEWQDKPFAREMIKKQEEFWLKEFPGEPPVLDLPFDYQRPALPKFEGANIIFTFEKEKVQALRDLALAENTTLYTVLFTIYNILLALISGQDDVVVGTVTQGRKHPDLEPIIGMFANILPVRLRPQGEKSFTSFLKEVKQKTLEVFENQDYPFESLVEKIMSQRLGSRHPMFDTYFHFYNSPPMQPFKTGVTFVGYHEIKNFTTKIDLNFLANEIMLEQIEFNLEYSTELFKEETVQRFANYYRDIVAAVLKNKQVKIKDLQITHGLQAAKSEVQGDFAF